MARLPRLVIPGLPMHIMMCGNNRQQIFFDDQERRSFLEWLRDAAREYELAVHAYVLMPNHVHLLLTPKHADSVARGMQSIGRRYAQLFNQAHGRTGTLWEGRFKSCVLEPESFFLRSLQYIEQNPVRTGLVQNPEDWFWSSYRHHIGAETVPWITDHVMYWNLGNTPFERQHRWQKDLLDSLPETDVMEVSDHLNHGWPLGSDIFLAKLAQKTDRPVKVRQPGRPKKMIASKASLT